MSHLQEKGKVKERPEECEVGERILPESVPHWSGRIRLVEFFPTNLRPDERPWIFAASYEGFELLAWRRVE